jgi:LmbE family N-acetylglucosaminyl deacetylase
MIRFFLIIIFVAVIVIWGIGFFLVNDLSLPTKDIKQFKHVLVIFPHADDEILSVGGVLHQLSSSGSDVTYLLLTQGERGTKDGKKDEDLKVIRVKEAEDVSKILGIQNIIQKDLGDYTLKDKKGELYGVIADTIYDEQPDLIITYDQAGLSGHPDHITVSEVVTDLVKTRYTKTKLWYTTYPSNVLSMVKLPTQMALDKEFINRREKPTLKVLIAADLIAKVQGTYAYKSQYESILESFPIKQIPLWLYATIAPFEYFHEAN